MATGMVYKNRKSRSDERKNSGFSKERTLDSCITEISGTVNWWNKDDVVRFENENNSKKYEFLKKNIKPSTVIPDDTEEVTSAPDKFGSFAFPGGILEVGYDKFPTSRNREIVFSLVPDKQEDERKIKKESIDDSNNYFGGLASRSNNRFGASMISVKASANSTKDVEKLEDDNDGIPDDETKLLYQDEKEKQQIRKLKEMRDDNITSISKIDKAIAKINDTKNEKKEDNLAFLRVIDNFMDKLRRGKLRKYVDSDDFIVRRKRITELSSDQGLSSLDLYELIKRLKEMLQDKEIKDRLGSFSEADFKNLTTEELRYFINGLANHFSGDNY